jgi:hypothetical protein
MRRQKYPSISRTEGSSITDEMARKRGIEPGVKHTRDRRSSEGHVVGLPTGRVIGH